MASDIQAAELTMLSMDWRTSLRKIVNREDRLGPVRLALLRMIDPIEWYMGKNDEERRPPRRPPGTGAAGWTGFAALEQRHSGAGVEAPSVLVAPPAESPEDARRRISEFWSRRDAMRRDHESYFDGRARDLLAGKQTTVETTNGTIRARLVSFRKGAVFECWSSSRQVSGHGMTRIERRHPSDPVSMLVNYLVEAVLQLGPDTQLVD